MVKASRSFQVFVKPLGAACNLACHYCYYIKKQDLFPRGETLRMSEDVLETYIVQHIEASPVRQSAFPGMAASRRFGLDYFAGSWRCSANTNPPAGGS